MELMNLNLIFLFALSALVGLGSRAFAKLCSNMVAQSSAAKYSLVLIVNCLVACLFFAISGGFRLRINTATLIYSVIYAMVAAASVVSNLIVYRLTKISNVNVISGACSMVCTVLLGWMLFSEPLSPIKLLRILLMLIAIYLVFVDKKTGEQAAPREAKRKSMILFLSVVAVIVLCGCSSNLVLKSFASSELVTDENSFFFYTNVVLIMGAIPVYAVSCLRNRSEWKSSLQLLSPKRLISLSGNTVCSNIIAILSVLIVAQMDVSLYSIISSAVGILLGVVASLLFRERLGRYSYLAAAIACIAIII